MDVDSEGRSVEGREIRAGDWGEGAVVSDNKY